MRKIRQIFTLSFFLSIVFTINDTLACSSMAKMENEVKSEKSCCAKESTEKSKNESESKETSETPKKHDCGGSCEDGSCHCIHISSVSAITIPILLKNNLIFQEFRKLVFSSVSANPSSGFYYIWLPPNIG